MPNSSSPIVVHHGSSQLPRFLNERETGPPAPRVRGCAMLCPAPASSPPRLSPDSSLPHVPAWRLELTCAPIIRGSTVPPGESPGLVAAGIARSMPWESDLLYHRQRVLNTKISPLQVHQLSGFQERVRCYRETPLPLSKAFETRNGSDAFQSLFDFFCMRS